MKHEFDFGEHVYVLFMGLPLKVVRANVIGIYYGVKLPDQGVDNVK